MGEEIDFEAAEKAAKAEAERIEKLGYDPEAEAAEAEKKNSRTASIAAAAKQAEIAAPSGTTATTASNAKPTHQRTPSEVERLGMGVGRLGFGQVGKSGATSSTAAAPKKMGFGSIGAPKAAAKEGKSSNHPQDPSSPS